MDNIAKMIDRIVMLQYLLILVAFLNIIWTCIV